MNKIQPLNVDDLSQIEQQASSNASQLNISDGTRQISRSIPRENLSDIESNILSCDDYPAYSNTKNNSNLDNNVELSEEVPRRRSTVNEDRNTPSRSQNSAENDSNIAATLEKTHHEHVATLRTNTFRAIISNEFDLTLFEWVKYVCYIFATIIIAFATTLMFTMIEIHNPLLYPEYWYEILYSSAPCFVFFSLSCAMLWSTYLNIDYINGIHRTLLLGFVGIVASHIILISAYVIWTYAANYRFPVINLSMIVVYPTWLIMGGTFWFSFPLEWREDNDFRRRMKFLIAKIIHGIALTIQFNVIYLALLMKYQNDYQPFIAIFFRALLELNLWIGQQIIRRTANGDVAGAQLVFSIEVGIRYTMIVCFTMENIATSNTEIVMMGIDFVYNVYLSLKIIWINKRRPDDRDNQMELIQELGTIELIEFTTPPVFILCTVAAYYGPNSKYLLNVGATVWHSTPIENINDSISAISNFFVVDFCSTIVTATLLWAFCKVNLLKAFIVLMKEFGPILCMLLTTSTYMVSTLLLVS